MLELIFHNVLIGRKIKLLYYFMYRLLMAFLLILYVRLSCRLPECLEARMGMALSLLSKAQ